MTYNGDLDSFLVSWNNSVPDHLKVTPSEEVTFSNLYRLLTDLITFWSGDQYTLTESKICNDEAYGRTWALSIKGDDIFKIAVTDECTETKLNYDGTIARYRIICNKFHIWVNMEYVNNLQID